MRSAPVRIPKEPLKEGMMTKISILSMGAVIFCSTLLAATDAPVGSCTATQYSSNKTAIGSCSVACQTGQDAHCTDSSTSNPPSCTCGYPTGGIAPTSPAVTSCTTAQSGSTERCSIACPVGVGAVCWSTAPATPPVACACRASHTKGAQTKSRPSDVGQPKK